MVPHFPKERSAMPKYLEMKKKNEKVGTLNYLLKLQISLPDPNHAQHGLKNC